MGAVLALPATTVALATVGAAPGLADPACTLNGSAFECTLANYTSTGAQGTFVVPAGITNVVVTAVGANGGSYGQNGQGGRGAVVKGTLAVNPGDTYYVLVGGSGGGGGAAGFNGGGASVRTGAGGGATDLRTLPVSDASTLTSRVIVAGGGGGRDVLESVEVRPRTVATAPPALAPPAPVWVARRPLGAPAAWVPADTRTAPTEPWGSAVPGPTTGGPAEAAACTAEAVAVERPATVPAPERVRRWSPAEVPPPSTAPTSPRA